MENKSFPLDSDINDLCSNMLIKIYINNFYIIVYKIIDYGYTFYHAFFL